MHSYAKLYKFLQNKNFQKFEKWGLLIFWAGAIYYLSSRPLEFLVPVDVWGIILRKLAHAFEFGVLTFLIFRVLGQTEKRHVYWNLFWAFIFTVLYAISDEYHQSLVQGRIGAYTDVLIDSAGGFVAAWLLYIYYHHEKVRQIKYKK